MSITQKYEVEEFSSSISKSGDVVNRQSLNLGRPVWQDLTETFGNHKSGDKEDLFIKPILGPTHDDLTRVLLTKGSTIHTARIVARAVTTGSIAMTVRVGALVRQPTVGFTGNFYGPTNRSWFHSDVLYSDFLSVQFPHSIRLSGSRVDDTSSTGISAALSGTGGSRLQRLGVNSDEDARSVSQENRIVVLDGPGNASFDRVDFGMAQVHSPTTEIAWVEVWDKPPIGPDTPDPTGTLIATSSTILLSSLGTSIGLVSFTFPSGTVSAGAGAQTVYSWLRSDATSYHYFMNIAFRFEPDLLYSSRIVGRGGGFMGNVYPTQASMPHISGATDDTLNVNLFGSTSTPVVLPTWTAGAINYISNLETVVQEWVDDAEFEDGDPIGLVVEALSSGGGGTRSLYMSGHATFPGGAALELNFTLKETIDSFTATPASIPVGAGSLLTWASTNGTTASIDNGVGSVAVGGQAIVSPSVTTTYTLTVGNGYTTTTAQVTVVVSALQISGFSPNETSIANAALTLLGELRIDSLNDESKTASMIAEQFADLRDQLLRTIPWNFATKRATLSLLAERPVWGFGYYYQLPDDCLRVLDVDNPVILPYRIEGRKIATSISAPLYIIYTARVEDPTQMDVLYREALSAYIAFTMAEAITGDSAKARQVFAIFQDRMSAAATATGQESTPREIQFSEHEAARGKLED